MNFTIKLGIKVVGKKSNYLNPRNKTLWASGPLDPVLQLRKKKVEPQSFWNKKTDTSLVGVWCILFFWGDLNFDLFTSNKTKKQDNHVFILFFSHLNILFSKTLYQQYVLVHISYLQDLETVLHEGVGSIKFPIKGQLLFAQSRAEYKYACSWLSKFS